MFLDYAPEKLLELLPASWAAIRGAAKRKQRIIAIGHRNPDFDDMAALQWIKRFVEQQLHVTVEIFYDGAPLNCVQQFGFSGALLESLDASDDPFVILVDARDTSIPHVSGEIKNVPLADVAYDHHEGANRTKLVHVYNREAGSAIALLILLTAYVAGYDTVNKLLHDDRTLALLVAMAIIKDCGLNPDGTPKNGVTPELVKNLFAYVRDFVNADALDQLNAPTDDTQKVLQMVRQRLTSRRIPGGKLFLAFVYPLPIRYEEDLALAADTILHEARTLPRIVVLAGLQLPSHVPKSGLNFRKIPANSIVYVKIRCSENGNPSWNLELLAKKLSRDAGGRAHSAGAKITLRRAVTLGKLKELYSALGIRLVRFLNKP